MECRICGNTAGNREYEAREMMYGLRDLHSYFQCEKCQCLQIGDVPGDLSPYYTQSYYSYQKPELPGWKATLASARDSYAIKGVGLFGRFLNRFYPHTNYSFLAPIRSYLNTDSRVMDVGCGAGRLLHSFRNAGYRHLLGIDPFLEGDIEYDASFVIKRQTIHEVSGQFDLIMFHHSFEHVPDPFETLNSVSALLSPNGLCVIRVPVVPCHAWEKYGVNWVQLDAPRHLFLHSVRSMELLSTSNGLRIERTEYDSTEFQFWASEQYLRDIPLKDHRSYGVRPRNSLFSKKDIAKFASEARRLNRNSDGDQAIFYLRRNV